MCGKQNTVDGPSVDPSLLINWWSCWLWTWQNVALFIQNTYFKSIFLLVTCRRNNICGCTSVLRDMKVSVTLNMMEWVSLSPILCTFCLNSIPIPRSAFLQLLPFLTSIMYSVSLLLVFFIFSCRLSIFTSLYCPRSNMPLKNLEDKWGLQQEATIKSVLQ